MANSVEEKTLVVLPNGEVLDKSAIDQEKQLENEQDLFGNIGTLSTFPTATIEELVEERRRGYGHPYDDFTRSTGMLNALGYCRIDAEGKKQPLGPLDLPIIMICIKLSRETHQHKEDNIIDIKGYCSCLDKVRARIIEMQRDLNTIQYD